MPWPETPCDDCPVSGHECLAQALRNPRLCERAADTNDEGIRELLGRQARARAIAPVPAQEHVSPTALPRAEWPLGIALVAWLAQPDDRGVGDTVARVVGPIGGDAFKSWYRRTMGQDCGCGSRQEMLNATYPYPPPEGMTKPEIRMTKE